MSGKARPSTGHAVAAESRRAALLRWLDSLDQEHGRSSVTDVEAADWLLDQVDAPTGNGTAT